MWLTPRSNRAFAGFLHPEMQRQKRIAGTEDIRGDRAQKSGPRKDALSGTREARKRREGNEDEKGGSGDEQERIMCRKGTCLFRACYLPIERSQEKQLDSS
ncbi:hypothetical protein G5I_00898 [Acromyrmex echinatior]|uniref:Uncharacterized protein n=1 Tax=Acromyrmex echinatior TaxID=103372 RepID=F4W6R5_ACREC|nr:hypothetical protein G5I_00898 [Acromyrmex echinatior]